MMQTSNTCMACACADKARDTTFEDKEYNWRNIGAGCVCIVVTALCNQPEDFASELGDNQSRYLYNTYDFWAPLD